MNALETLVPLRRWIRDEESQQYVSEEQTRGPDEILWLKKIVLLRKTTVAYGIVELLRHAKIVTDHRQLGAAFSSDAPPSKEFNIENFVVILSYGVETLGNCNHASWNNVRGVRMLSPALSAQITEPHFLSTIADKNIDDYLARYLEVSITPPLPGNVENIGDDNNNGNGNDCNLFGILLYELYSGVPVFPTGSRQGQQAVWETFSQASSHSLSSDNEIIKKAKRTKTTVRYDKRKGKSYFISQQKSCTPLLDLGFPSSISGLVQNLIDGHESYTTLKAASSDIHMLLSDPACFLFDLQNARTQGGSVQLSFRNHKLYGRESQVSQITDAFCRVSSGKNEAFFIGGFSGSGKTKLVQSLTARVVISGGYVLTQKIDQMHRERPLLGVLSAFNNLCALIRDNKSPQEIHDISNKLKQSFESDFSALARLLPNISVFSSDLKTETTEEDISDQMNFHNICFLLQRFIRVVSNSLHPVMLFLDDLQWCGATSLDLIHAILSDKRGSNCFFFVGSYRDNEVDDDHPIFTMMSKLESSSVPITKLSLEGLTPEDLNAMVSDAMGMFPRLCTPLSEIVYQKTKGNPFFVIEFLGSLVDSRLLKYSLRQKIWIWDIDKIGSENITGNVLYLLTRKMTSFPHSSQLALKVLSLFGIKVDGAIVEYLSLTPEYSGFREWLDHIISQGCMRRVGTSDVKFVHDKVQEAAYGLIPEGEKDQFHFNIGHLLYSISREQGNMGGAIFQICDQINHGTESMIRLKTRKDIIMNLNFTAGLKAMDLSDYATALSYLDKAFSMLPENHWTSNYDFSLRLYLLTAKSSFSCGNIEKAYAKLKEIIREGRCLGDKLDAYSSYVMILTSEGRIEAWTTCCEVLSKLNETIPDSFDAKATKAMMKQTGNMLERISYSDILEMQEMDSRFHNTLRFYALLLSVTFWKKPQLTITIACRMIKFTLDHGICKDSAYGFVQYAAAVCHGTSKVKEACRIGNIAMMLLKRNDSSADIVPKVYFFHYGFVAPYTEPLQVCTKNLRKSFDIGMSTADLMSAANTSLILMKLALFSGEHLGALLSELDSHLELMNRFQNKLIVPYLLSYRETLLILTGQSLDTNGNAASSHEGASNSGATEAKRQQIMFMNRMLQSFWCGYSQRCHHYVRKTIECPSSSEYNKLFASWLGALNSFRGIKNNNGSGSKFLKAKVSFKSAISALRSAAELSRWNFQNKVFLLEAEMYSFERRNIEAKASYAAAITAAASSRLVHEHGLAMELAGLHYIKIGESEIALDFLQQARESYQKWGSSMKVASVNQQMGKILSEASQQQRNYFSRA